jgi:hypothetical protein
MVAASPHHPPCAGTADGVGLARTGRGGRQTQRCRSGRPLRPCSAGRFAGRCLATARMPPRQAGGLASGPPLGIAARGACGAAGHRPLPARLARTWPAMIQPAGSEAQGLPDDARHGDKPPTGPVGPGGGQCPRSRTTRHDSSSRRQDPGICAASRTYQGHGQVSGRLAAQRSRLPRRGRVARSADPACRGLATCGNSLASGNSRGLSYRIVVRGSACEAASCTSRSDTPASRQR